MRGMLILVVITLALLVGGGQGVYEWATNRHCNVVTYEEFVRQKPRHGWFEIRNCSLNVLEAMYKKRFCIVTEAYVPLRGRGDEDETETKVLLLTKDPQILATVKEGMALDKNAGPAEALSYVSKNGERLFLDRDVRGMVQFGIDVKSRINNKLAKLDHSLAPDFVVLEEGKEPEIGFPLFALTGGLLLSTYLGRRLLKRDPRRNLPAVPPSEAFDSGAPRGPG